MSLELDEIIKELAFSGLKLRKYGTPCNVLSIDEETATVECEPIDGTADYLSCKLQTGKSSGLLYVPKVGSVVMVEQTSGSSGYITMYGEIEEVIFLDGTNKGMVKVSELVEQLNTLQNDINTLKQAFSAWVTVPNDGGAALKAAATAWYSQSLTPTQIDDLENKKVQH